MFQDSLIANLLRLIQKMKPKPKEKQQTEVKTSKDMSDIEIKKKLFPGLALPNDTREKSPVKVKTFLNTTFDSNSIMLNLCTTTNQMYIALLD